MSRVNEEIAVNLSAEEGAVPESASASNEVNYDESVKDWWTHSPITVVSNFSNQRAGDEKPPDDYQVAWCPGELENPRNWSSSFKWFITIFYCSLVLDVTFASSAPSTACKILMHEFGISIETSTLVTTLYLCGYIAGPVIWGPLSELIGRRPVSLIAFGFYILWHLGAALNTRWPLLLAARFFTGFFASAQLSVCAGIIADMWDSFHRVQALSLQVFMGCCGPVIAPIVGSAIVESCLGYRWIFRLIMIYSVATWCMMFFVLPETYAPILLVKKARHIRETTGNSKVYASHEKADVSVMGILRRTVFRPIEMMVTEPILLLGTTYIATVTGILYSLFETFPIIWQDIRGFNSQQSSLVFLGITIGCVVGTVVNLYLSRSMKELDPKQHGNPSCEMNLYAAMAAGPFLVVGILWLGWAGAYTVAPWWLAALPTVFLGISFDLGLVSIQCYLVDVYLTYAASALAASTVCRAVVGAAVPMFTRRIFYCLGTQWACTLIGLFALIISPSPVLFYKCGNRMRTGSKFGKATNMKQIKQDQAEFCNPEIELNNLREPQVLVPTITEIRHECKPGSPSTKN